MSEMRSQRPDPVSVVEGSIIGIIPNPMSGRDIRRLTSQASVFPNTEKASMVLRIPRTLGTRGVPIAPGLLESVGVLASTELKR